MLERSKRKLLWRIVYLILPRLNPLVEDAVLCSVAHSLINGTPSSKVSREASPLASIFRPRQKGVEPLQVGNLPIPSLRRPMGRDRLMLFFW